MTTVFYHSPENGQAVPEVVRQRKEAQEHSNSGKQAGAGSEWTFQSLLTAVADGDEKHLFECISHLEYRIQEFEKIFVGAVVDALKSSQGCKTTQQLTGSS